LSELADDHGARGVGELLELAQVVADRAARARPLAWGADQQGLFDRRGDDDRISAYCSFLI
jgi:hypothetical protein